MSPQTTRRLDKDEEELIEDEVEGSQDEEEAEKPARGSVPAVSDSRRRRLAKRGIVSATPAKDEDEEEEESAPQPARKDRPTPSQREETAKSANFVVRFYQNSVEYLQETRSELRKTTWLSREDVLRLTRIVIVVTAASALFLGFVSLVFSAVTTQLANPDNSVWAGLLTIAAIIVVTGGWLLRDRLFGGPTE